MVPIFRNGIIFVFNERTSLLKFGFIVFINFSTKHLCFRSAQFRSRGFVLFGVL